MSDEQQTTPSADELLRRSFPEIDWDEPVPVHVIAYPRGRWVCRYCIVRYGLVAADSATTPFAYDTKRETRAHIAREHRA